MNTIKKPATAEQVRAVEALLWAFYNVGSFLPPGDAREWSICDFLRECNPEVHESYLEEKAAIWRKAPYRLVLSFDAERLDRFVSWCLARAKT